MTATDLSVLEPPPELLAWLRAADPVEEIFNHRVTVDLSWWNEALRSHALAGGPICGYRDGKEVSSGRATITRADLFRQSAAARETKEGAQRLLWHSLAWGSGLKVRKNLQRMETFSHLPGGGEALVEAAVLAGANPLDAYERLRPRGVNLVTHLGPAFFTKFLYFAGGREPENQSLILDSVVAQALKRRGWSSLRSAGWPAPTYGRYLELVERWRGSAADSGAGNSELPRRDLIEKYLFTADPR